MKAGDVLRWILTAGVVLIWAWWLYVVLDNAGVPPLNDAGAKLGFDHYGRVKDILGTIAPVLTLVLGYWFGVKGADAAKDQAESAKSEAAAANQKADAATKSESTAKGVAQAVIGAAHTNLDNDQLQAIIKNARTFNAAAFGDPDDPAPKQPAPPAGKKGE